MRPPVRLAAALFVLAALSGCRSSWVEASVVNQEDVPVNLVEVDYPGGSFGVQSIAPHAAYRYRFHILADEAATISFTDASGKPRQSTGPQLNRGERGTLRIEIAPGNQVHWSASLSASK